MTPSRRVLIIAYLFPPAGGAGVQRTLKFVKYLPQCGWNPVVLTSKESTATLIDQAMVDEIPSGTEVHRAFALLPPRFFPSRLRRLISRWLLVVDEQLGWFPIASRSGARLASDVQALYSTSGPYTNHLVGLRLKERTGLPWIVDFRDPWIGNAQLIFPTRFHRKMVESLEWKVVEAADRVLVVSKAVHRAFTNRYPNLSPSKFIYLPNGYDPQDFENFYPIQKDVHRFTITYTGSFYLRGRSPVPFLKSLLSVFERGDIPRQKISVNLIGNISQDIRNKVQELGLQDTIHFTGYIEHQHSIGYLKAADLLLLLVGDASDSQAVMPGKIFEYLAARRPILALAPDGVAADLLKETLSGVVVPPNDLAAIAEQLVKLYKQWEAGTLTSQTSDELINRYDRCSQTKTLAEILEDICLRSESQ